MYKNKIKPYDFKIKPYAFDSMSESEIETFGQLTQLENKKPTLKTNKK